jgi:hypothetical protein
MPLLVKKTMVKALVDELNVREQNFSSTTPPVVKTPTHAIWMMECAGQVVQFITNLTI